MLLQRNNIRKGEIEMTPVIRISDEIFQRLQLLATPLVDTPATVVQKLLDSYESHNGGFKQGTQTPERTPSMSSEDGVDRFDPDSPPDLTHTEVIAAKFDGVPASSWND